ncbi:MAG: hypothetical protein E7671_00165 [Ruminococcaceae bacterium]|nr:hypothetical protein [Oscillospiraceae bacterium]
MKKILALILAAMMIFAVVSCGNTNTDGKDTDTDAVVDTTVDTTEDTATDTDVDTTVDTDAVDGETEGSALEAAAKAVMEKYAEFAGMRASYDEYMAMDDVEEMTYEEYISYQIMIEPVEAGAELLQGFTTAPTGYTEAYSFYPGMMGAPFIGYIFTLEEGADVEAFKTFLTENCDMRWNICTSANTVVCENVGNVVYFNMLVVDGEMGGFTAEQKDEFVNAFKAVIEG